jgi:RluA family pseudouridine synthase
MPADPAGWELWRDAQLLVIDKPAGLPTLPDGYHKEAPHVKSVLEPLYGRLWIVHRLDKDTSGVLVLARSAEAHRSLNMQFEQHTTEKIYHALVRGDPPCETYSVHLPLRTDGDRRHRTVVDPQQGKPAVTHLRVLQRLAGWTWLEARLETGRTHQIRAHLAALGLPLAGDALYGGKAQLYPVDTAGSPLVERLCLHAWRLALDHPVTGERLTFTAPEPAELVRMLEGLGMKGGEESPLSPRERGGG